MVVTPGSDKKANKKGKGTPNKMGTPVTGKDHSTPGSQKKTPTTPQSQKAATPKSAKQETPQSIKQKPASTPQQTVLQTVQFTTPKSPKNNKTPQSQKPTKPDTPHPQKAITPQSQKQKKQTKPTMPGGTPPTTPGGTPGSKDDKVSAKKRKTMSSDEDEFDSAEEDFEALLGNKKPKTEEDTAAKKLKPSASPAPHSPAVKVATPGGTGKKPDTPVATAVSVPSGGTPAAVTTSNKKRALVDDTVPTEKKLKLTTVGANSKFTGLTEADVATDLKRQETLDRSLLYISKIPSNITETQLKALHPGIVHVDLIRPRWGNSQKKQQLYAHIELRNEKAADEAYKLLCGRKFGDREIIVDYVGSKSERQTKLKSVKADELDPCKLFVRHFPQDTTTDELKSLFPTADKVELLLKKDGKPLGFAFIHYSDPSVCYSAHSAAEHLTIRQHSLGVVFGRKLTVRQEKTEKKKKATKSNGQKQLTASGDVKPKQVVTKGQLQIVKGLQEAKGQKPTPAGKQTAKKVKLEVEDKKEGFDDDEDDESDEDDDEEVDDSDEEEED